MDEGSRAATERVLVLNPVSGDADHADRVRELAADHGFAVRETEGEGDAERFAAAAADEGADLVAAAGGDGTLNEVICGLVEADALPDVGFAVVPAGTGNNFAENVGIEGIEHAFEVIESGERRRIDLGFADDAPFLNSAICGLTADASADTDPESKSELGVLAYVVETLRTAADFDGVPLEIEAFGEVGGETEWSGTAVLLLVGNARCFPARGRSQADVEDGLFDVTVVEERPGSNLADLARTTMLERVLGTDADDVTRLRAPALSVTVAEDDPATFSLDGELRTTSAVHLRTEPSAVQLPVGTAYQPDPESD
ncbi:diacylglycerol kinase [Halorientalis sp. IM1011]|uniref:diacylglycerol/lipid kinase family protein n=1 Tax=Halorientalis sp. IM1011 TaxID=1932360 RepID=UPI00097CCD01|nr:diacylglycerol kinase [Halorientalis sp. IM1011]